MTETRNLLAVRPGDTVILNYRETMVTVEKRVEIKAVFLRRYKAEVVWVPRLEGSPLQVALVVRGEPTPGPS